MLRWVAWAWMAVVLAVSRDDLAHPGLAAVLGGAALAVTIVDTDVHPLPVSGAVLRSYAPPEWKDKLWPTGNAVSPMSYFYDTPDAYKTSSLRVDASPPRGGAAGGAPGHSSWRWSHSCWSSRAPLSRAAA